MDWESAFSVANLSAMVCWVVLIFLPRWRWLLTLLRAVVLGLCAVYTVLAFVYFFRVEGGGFSSLEAVSILFSSPPVLLAGWVHYLAFDLFAGLWIAARADSRRMPRLVQAPILVTTFMFGPVGLLVYMASELAPRRAAAASAA